MERERIITNLPDTEEIEAVLTKRKQRLRYWTVMRNVIAVMITVSAFIVLVTMLLMPVLRIYGKSMTPTLESGNIVLSARSAEFGKGDVVAFYYNNKVLVKRVVAESGDTVDIREDGTVYINGQKLDEPYVSDKGKGECDIEFPYQVPEAQVFVLGDCRSNSTDSRSSEIGCIDEERILGKIIFRVYPFDKFGTVG